MFRCFLFATTVYTQKAIQNKNAEKAAAKKPWSCKNYSKNQYFMQLLPMWGRTYGNSVIFPGIFDSRKAGRAASRLSETALSSFI